MTASQFLPSVGFSKKFLGPNVLPVRIFNFGIFTSWEFILLIFRPLQSIFFLPQYQIVIQNLVEEVVFILVVIQIQVLHQQQQI